MNLLINELYMHILWALGLESLSIIFSKILVTQFNTSFEVLQDIKYENI